MRRAADFGVEAVALTDTNNLYGAVPFYKLSRQAGIRPVTGSSLEHHTGNAVVLARNITGYSNLCRIITELNLNERFDTRRALRKLSDGLVVMTEDTSLVEALLEDIERRYLVMELAYPGRTITTLRRIREFADARGLDTVATGDVYFLEPGDHALHRVMTAIKNGKAVSECDTSPSGFVVRPTGRRPFSGQSNRALGGAISASMAPRMSEERCRTRDAYFASPQEMAERFKRFPGALEKTLEIADMCRLDIPMGRPIFPRYPLPPGETPNTLLGTQCAEGLRRRYHGSGASLRRKAKERIRRELELIQRLGFSEYFIIVADIVRYARSRGIPVVGRGSGASSIVSYVLGITDVDPIAFNLPFERFLNIGRTDCPDIDVDFCWRMRDEVIDYVYKKYGAEYVAMICTHTMFRKRGAFRETAKAHGVSNNLVNRISKKISYEDGIPLRQEIAGNFPEVPLDEEPFATVLDTAERIIGAPHNLNIHCGGVVISDRPIYTYVPLEKAPKGIVITQYEMRAIEDIGLVKIDLLGNRALSAVRESLDIMKRSDASPPPDGDPKTIRLLQKGKTLGCCQLESPAMRHLLSMLRPESVRRVIQALALIRPAPASIGMKEAFVRRARGIDPVHLPHPSLEDVLGDTYGIMLYEDDAMLVGSVLAGISLEEGDKLRKAIKKSRSREDLAKVSRYFLGKAIRNGIPRETAEEMWVQMAKFTEYSFCRSHAAGYGLVAYHEAYLKAHHPAAYMTAAINNVQGIYPRRVYVWEAKRLGADVLPPCVNNSRAEFTAEHGYGDRFQICPHIRMGLSEVRLLHAKTLEAILREREREPFFSLHDFLSRVPISLPELENLALAGAFDFTGLSRPRLVWQCRSAHGGTKRMPPEQGRLMVAEDPCLPPLPDYSTEAKVGYEMETTGCPLSAHPAELAREKLKRNGLSLARDIPDLTGRNIRLLGIIDTARTTVTRNDEPMEFVTFEDETGIFDVTLFPRTLRKLRTILRGPGPYVINGTVDSRYDAVTVTAREVKRTTR